MNKKIAFSGIQPTGIIHIGNYLGAIKNWVEIQEQFASLFCIVDLHAITVKQDPKKLSENTYKTIATILAAGIDPKKSTIFFTSSKKTNSLFNINLPLYPLDLSLLNIEIASSRVTHSNSHSSSISSLTKSTRYVKGKN